MAFLCLLVCLVDLLGQAPDPPAAGNPAPPTAAGIASQAEAPNTTPINANGTWLQKVDINLTPPGFLKLAAAASNATVHVP